MTNPRTDNPRKTTVLLSEEARRLLALLADKRIESLTDVIERAIRELAKAEQVS